MALRNNGYSALIDFDSCHKTGSMMAENQNLSGRKDNADESLASPNKKVIILQEIAKIWRVDSEKVPPEMIERMEH